MGTARSPQSKSVYGYTEDVYEAILPQICVRCKSKISRGELFTRSRSLHKITYTGIRYCQCNKCAPLELRKDINIYKISTKECLTISNDPNFSCVSDTIATYFLSYHTAFVVALLLEEGKGRTDIDVFGNNELLKLSNLIVEETQWSYALLRDKGWLVNGTTPGSMQLVFAAIDRCLDGFLKYN